MCKLAQLRAMNGEFESARTMYRQARSLLDELGQGVRAAQSSLDLATIELLAGDAAAAEREARAGYETLVHDGRDLLPLVDGRACSRARCASRAATRKRSR